MKIFLVATLLCLTSAAICAQSESAPARPPRTAPSEAMPVHSPEIDPDLRVTFRLRAPKATEVSVSGEFMRGSSKPLVKDDKGVWTYTTDPLPPEIYAYNFTIDGIKTIDPGNPQVKTGSTAGTIGSLLEVPAATPTFYDLHDVPHGEIRTDTYQSASLHSIRRVTIYTPPGFDPSGKTKYPVLYLLHGANADETAWNRLGHVSQILDNLLADGKIKPFLAVMPFGYPADPNTLPPGGGFTDIAIHFGEDLMHDVIPYVESHYPALKDRDHRALAGLSMGGVESLTIGLNHLELFSYVAGFSAAIRPADFPRDFGAFAAKPQEDNAKLHLLWLGVGRQDGLMSASDSFSKFLDTAGIKHTYTNSEGAHTWIVWRQYLRDFAPLLFR